MADTHKVKVLLTAEAGRLRRALRGVSKDSKRLGGAFTSTARKGDTMAERVREGGGRARRSITKSTTSVKRLGGAFTGTAGKSDAMAERVRAGGGRARRAIAKSTTSVKRLGGAFTGTAGKSDAMAERVRAGGGRARRAIAKSTTSVKRLGGAFTKTASKSDAMAERVRAGGGRVRGSITKSTTSVKRLGTAFTKTASKSDAMAERVRAGGGRIHRGMEKARQGVRRLGAAFTKTGNKATTMGAKAAAARRRLGGALGSVAGALGLAGGAFAIGAATKRIASMETRMERLGIQSGRSREEMEALRDEISETANAPEIRVDASQLLSAVEAIVEKTGDLEFARTNLRTLAEAIQGAGGTGDAHGRLTAELRKFGLTEQKEVSHALNLLTAQGKSGAFTLGNLAAQGERLFSAFAGLGYTGPGAVRQLGAIAQTARQATGSSDRATTAIEAMLRALSDAKKLEKLEEIGVRVRGDDGQFRDLNKILTETIAAVDGDMVKLSEIFDAEAMRVFNALTEQGQRDYGRFLGLEVQGNELAGDAARIASTTGGQAQAARTSLEQKLTEHFTGPLRHVATTLTEFQGELVAAAGAAVAATVAFKGVRGLAGLFSSGRRNPAGAAVPGLGGDVPGADLGLDGAPKRGDGKGKRLGPRVERMQVGTMRVARMIGGKGAAARRGAGTAAAGGAAATATAASANSKRNTASRVGGGGVFGALAVVGGAVLGADLLGEVIQDQADQAGVDLDNPILRVDQLSPRGAPAATEADAVDTPHSWPEATPGAMGGRRRGGSAVDRVFGPWVSPRARAGSTPAAGPEELDAVVVTGVRPDPAPWTSPRGRQQARPILEPRPNSGYAADGGVRETATQVHIGSVNVRSNASDPRKVADEVADLVANKVADVLERRQRNERLRVESAVAADDTPEVSY